MAIQFLNNQYISGTLEVAGATTFDTVANPGSDTDKFVVINGSGLLGFRTGAEILADIGAASSATSVTSVSGTQPIISSGGLTPTISLNYTGANNLIESATDLEGNSIATADSIIYNDATDGNVKKGLISDLPFSNTSGTVTSITPGADSGTGTAITTSGTITVAGGSNITTSVSGTTITVNTDFNQYGWSITDGSTTNSIPSGTTVTFQGGTGINTSLNGYILDIEIDSSVVPGGSGTAGKLTKWTATKTLGDGPVTISGSDATFDGHITLASDKKVNFGASSYIEGATSGSKLMFRSSDDMIFQPGSSTKVTFQANGNVGIGTGSPDAPLHILKAAGGANIVTALKLDPDDATVNSGTSIDFNASSTNTGASLVGSRIVGAREASNASGYLSFYTSPDASGSVPLERMRVTSAGNVGIGTTSPSFKLDISNTTFGDQLRLHRSSVASGGFLTLSANDSAGNKQDYAKIGAIVESATSGSEDGTLVFQTSLNSVLTERARLDSSGNLGLGTTTMNTTLNLYSSSNTQIGFQDASTGTGSADGFRVGYNGTYGQLWLFENADFRIATNNTERMRIDSSGQVIFKGTGNGVDLRFKDISAAISSETAGYIGMSTSGYSGNNGDLVLIPRTSSASNILLMQGNVGIGTTSPSRGLTVSGAGVAGTILATDGTVNTVLWGDASGSNHGGVGTDNNYGFNIYQNGGIAIEIDTSKNATFAGAIIQSMGNPYTKMIDTSSGGDDYGLNNNASKFSIYNWTDGREELYFGGDGNAVFTGGISVHGNSTIGDNFADAHTINGSTTIRSTNTSTVAVLDVTRGDANNEGANATDFRFVAANRAITTERANMEIYTNNAQAADLGGSIGFGGRHTDSSTNDSLFATIKAGKSNATTGNYLGYLEIGTSDAASDITRRFIIDSTGATFAGTVSGTTATFTTFSGDLNGTINTATTAVTKGNAVNDTTVATTAFVQNVIGTIPAGLVFQGTWNASTNTPTLASGTGTTGHFYIVSVAGSTNLDGVTDWEVGDWAVFIEQGASDQWEKIDNSSVLGGSGSGGSLAAWAGSGTSVTLTNAPVTYSGNNSTFAGNVFARRGSFGTASNFSFDLYVNGDAYINDALTVDDNATFAGDVGMGKLTATKSGTAGVFNSGTTNVVASFTSTDATGVIQLVDNGGNVEIGASGNDFVVQPAGGVAQLTVGSSSSTFAGNITAGSTSLAASNSYVLDVKKAYSSGNGHVAYFGAGAITAAKVSYDTVVVAQDDVTCLAIVEGNSGGSGNEQALRLAVGDNNAVISSTSTASGGMSFFVNRATTALGYQVNVGTRALHLANNGVATFAGDTQAQKVTSTKGFFATGNIDAPASGTSALIMDYYLGNSRFWSRGADATTKGGFQFIQLENDGGGQTTSLAIDTSGNATFTASGGQVLTDTNGHITSFQTLDTATAGGRFIGKSNRGVLGSIHIEQTATSADGGYIGFETSPSGSTTPTERMRIDSSGIVTVTSPNSIPFRISRTGGAGQTAIRLTNGSSDNVDLTNDGSNNFTIATGGSERMRILSSGAVGIGTTSPQEKLHVYNAGTARIEVEGTSGPSAFKATNSQGSFGWYIPSNANEFRLWNFGTSADLVEVDASGNTTFSGDVSVEGDGSDFFVKSADYTIARIIPRGSGSAVDKGLFSLFDGSTETVRIDTGGDSWFNGNNVGIGTTSPGAKLNVFTGGNSIAAAAVLQHDTFAVDRKVGLGFELGDTQIKAAVGFISDASSPGTHGRGNLIFCVDSNDDAAPVSHSDEKMRITHGGNVGIGTTAPIVPVHIVGTAVNNPSNAGGGYEVMQVFDDTSANTGVGGGIGLGGKFNSSGTDTIFSEIRGIKENSIDSNYAGALTFSTRTNGANITERMRITSAGLVGIGETSPDTTLHVTGDSGITIEESGGTTRKLILEPPDGSTSAIIRANGSSNGLLLKAASGGNQLFLKDDGKVGIGTASPETGLHLYGTSNTASNFTIEQVYSGTSKKFGFQPVYNDDRLDFWYNSNATVAMTIKDGGNVGIGTTSPDEKLDVAGKVQVTGVSLTVLNASDPALTVSDTDTNYRGSMRFNTTDNTLEFFTRFAGTYYTNNLVLKQGNVGIGTASPTNYKLEVDGTVEGSAFSVDGASSRIFAPAGATYNGNSSTQTGYLIAKLPDNGASGINNMMTGVIRVFDYTHHESFDVHFAGYWYSGYNWTNCTAWIDSSSYDDRNFTVRFGAMTGAAGAGTRPYIIIGEGTSTWSYCKFSVINYEPGHSNYEAYKWDSGWNMDISATNPGVVARTVSNCQVNNWARNGQDLYYGSGTGNVGIGTTSPQDVLNINDSSSSANIGLKITRGGQTHGLRLGVNDSHAFLWTTEAQNLAFATSNTQRLTITAAGNVGIGTDSPTKSLTVNAGSTSGGGINITGSSSPAIYIDETSGVVNSSFQNDSSGSYLGTSTSHPMIFRTANTERARIDSDGHILLGTDNKVGWRYTSGDISYNFITGEDQILTLTGGTWTTNATQSAVRIKTKQGEKLTVLNNGNVGIGTTSPSSILHVASATNPVLRVEDTTNSATVAMYATDSDLFMGAISNHPLKILTNDTTRFEISTAGKCAINHAVSNRTLVIGGALDVQGTLYKTSGSFAIDHPLESKKDTHKLIHSFIEGPKADNIYRGKAQLKDGSVIVNLDTVSEMTEGTFVLLNRDVQCFTSNESDWDPVKGTIEGNLLTISCKNTSSNAMISWMVVGERQDKEIKQSEITDDNGKIIVEPTIEEFEK